MRPLKAILVAGVIAATTLTALADDSRMSGASADTATAMPAEESQGKTFAVDCYQGKPNEGLNLGSLTVTSPTEAGPACNATYYDCHDTCYGCYSGPDGQICSDKFGSVLKR